jgi:hypothetical protein
MMRPLGVPSDGTLPHLKTGQARNASKYSPEEKITPQKALTPAQGKK